MVYDSTRVYGRVTQALHWWMAVLLILQGLNSLLILILGGGREGNPVSMVLGPQHRVFGIAVLLLVLSHIVWAITQRGHRPKHLGLSGRLAVAGHIALFLFVLIVSITGPLLDWGRGEELKIYGVLLFNAGPERAWAIALGSLHANLSWTLIILIGGHIAVALYHQFVLRDNLIARMIRKN
jgi:cytochrome b561